MTIPTYLLTRDKKILRLFVVQYTDDLVPLMEFTNEQLGAASREIFTGLDILLPLFSSILPPNTIVIRIVKLVMFLLQVLSLPQKTSLRST